MKLVYTLLALITCIAIYILVTRCESFDSLDITAGLPEGKPRIRKVLVNMGDHTTMATIFHGTIDEYVILVHGYPLTQQIWTRLLEKMTVRAHNGVQVPTVITYDLRGCGYAVNATINHKYLDPDPNNAEWSLNLFVNDLYRIYTDIIGSDTNTGTRKISIGGWGFGGCIAQEFAIQHPNIIKGLYLFSTLGVAIPSIISDIQELSRQALEHQTPSLATLHNSYINNILCTWFNVEDYNLCPTNNDTQNETGTLLFETIKTILTTASIDAQLQVLKIIYNLNLLEHWSNATNITYDVSFISPTQDSVSPPNQLLKLYTIIKNKYRGTRQPTISTPTGKHSYCLEYPDSMMSIICRACT